MAETATSSNVVFDQEYATFNYIMVGASCGILLLIIIIARLLCICNKRPWPGYHDQAQLIRNEMATSRTLVPQRIDFQGHNSSKAGHKNGDALSNVHARIPGEVSPEGHLPHGHVSNARNHSNKHSPLRAHMQKARSPSPALSGMWHPTGTNFPRLDHSPPAPAIQPHHHHYSVSSTTTAISSTARPTSSVTVMSGSSHRGPTVKGQEITTDNVTNFLQHLQTMVNTDVDRNIPVFGQA